MHVCGRPAAPTTPRTLRRLATATLAAFAAASPARGEEEILHVHAPSLETYLADARSPGQDARPRAEQRGVALDGTLLHPMPWPVASAGNAAGEAWTGRGFLADIRLDAGTWSDLQVDLALPAPGFSWVLGRTYNARQQDADGTLHLSDGPQGRGWFQVSQPEIVLHDADGDPTTHEPADVLYLVYGADRFLDLRRDGDRNQFIATNGGAGVAVVTPADETQPELICYTGQDGWSLWFFGFENAAPAPGRLWRIVDPFGHTAGVGHLGDPAEALADGFHPDGSIALAYDTAGRRYDYALDGSGRFASITVSVETEPGAWVETDEITYAYGGALGGPDDLTEVAVRTRVSDDDPDAVSRWSRCYVYYGDADPDESSRGLLRFVLEPEGIRRWKADRGPAASADATHAPGSALALAPYASRGFAYDAQRRIRAAWFDGRPEHTWTFAYETNPAFADTGDYDAGSWQARTIVARPDGSFRTHYFDDVGQPLHDVLTDGPPGPAAATWVTAVQRDDAGQVVSIGTPASVASYVHDLASWTLVQYDQSGLVWRSERIGSGEGQGLRGYLRHAWWQLGASDAATTRGLLFSVFYDVRTLALGAADSLSLVHPWVEALTEYHDGPALVPDDDLDAPPPAGAARTTWDVQFNGPGFIVRRATETDPVVAIDENGSGVAATRAWYFDDAGRLEWHRDPAGVIHYWSYDGFGRLELWGEDVDTSITGDLVPWPPPGFESGGRPLHRLLVNTYIEPGTSVSGGGITGGGHQRRPSVTDYKGRRQRRLLTTLADGRTVELIYPDHSPERPDPVDPDAPPRPGNYAGPVTALIRGLDGQPQVVATIALPGGATTTRLVDHVDETQADPLAALAPLGPIAELTALHHDASGARLLAARIYHAIPAPGEEARSDAHFDPWTLDYDGLSRLVRACEPDGTITRVEYDSANRVTQVWIGTDDGGGPGDDLVLIETREYDHGDDGGNGLLTRRTQFTDADATDARQTVYDYDSRGRLALVTNPAAPAHVLLAWDNAERLTAAGIYAPGTVSPADDPVTRTAGRLSLQQWSYDARGRVWRATQRGLDPGPDAALETDLWYDPAGRIIRVGGAEQIKLRYDRLGRPTHQFILAECDDDDFADVYDEADAVTSVAGDIVLRETRLAWDFAKDDLVLEAVIDRHPDDAGPAATVGPLDADRDGDPFRVSAADLRGRAQIITHWYDRQARRLLSVAWGTGSTDSGQDFDRRHLAAPVTSGPQAQRTAFGWDDAGRLGQVTDPAGRVTRYGYDAAGRVTTVVEHFVDGIPDLDADRVVRYEYDAGRVARLIADLPDPQPDQITEYRWGTVRGPGSDDSAIASGRLLREIMWPPQEPGQPEADRVLRFAYNAQGELIRQSDALGTVIAIDLDAAGRPTSRRIVALDASVVDEAVRRIDYDYTDLGLLASVAQADDPAPGAGSVLDEVRVVYGDWHRPTALRQDANGAIDAPGSMDDAQVAWTEVLAAPAGGRHALRRTSMSLPGGALVEYDFDGAAAGSWDDVAGRVTRVRQGSQVLASYRYLGPAAVAGIELPEVGAAWRIDASPAGPGQPVSAAPEYPCLDRFNRVVRDRWTRQGPAGEVVLHDVELARDVMSSIVARDDHVVPGGFDVAYAQDSFDRLAAAQHGTLTGGIHGTLEDPVREESWSLDAAGNWAAATLDLDGDGSPSGSGEIDEVRDHDGANAIRWRDLDDDGSIDQVLVHDRLGRLTDDGAHFRYVWDAFGRLRQVLDRDTGQVVAEHRYNGLGWRIASHADENGDGIVEDGAAGDPWRHLVYDDAWRVVAVLVEGEAGPRERYVHHNAGRDGRGGSSYLDALICRDRNLVVEPADPSDPPEERLVYLHDVHADVVMLLDAWGTAGGWNAAGAAAIGGPVELIRYTPYGEPFAMPAGDLDADGDLDETDLGLMLALEQSGGYDARADLDADGALAPQDRAMAEARLATLGRGVLSHPDIASSRGYAGYTFDAALAAHAATPTTPGPTLYHVRHRVLHTQLGRWLTRDPLGYVGGANQYEYASGIPVSRRDPSGLAAVGGAYEPQAMFIGPGTSSRLVASGILRFRPALAEDNGWSAINAVHPNGQYLIHGVLLESGDLLQMTDILAPPTLRPTPDLSDDSALDTLQTMLDAAGLVPGLGEPADALNALISFARGDTLGGTLSLAAMVPIAGSVATAGKAGRRAGDGLAGAPRLTPITVGGRVPPGQTLHVGPHRSALKANQEQGITRSHHAHHIEQDAASKIPTSRGITITIPAWIHRRLASTGRKAGDYPGLEADIANLRDELIDAGWHPADVDRGIEQFRRQRDQVSR